MPKKLPEPACELGYTQDQLEEFFGNRITAFYKFMAGQTIGGCDGRRYDYETKQYVSSGCGPHGWAYYTSDVRQFILGGPPLD